MNWPKKIAIVSNTSWSIYNFRLGLIMKLKELGFKVTLIAPKDNFTAKLIAEEFDFREIRIRNYGTNPFNELSTLKQLNRIYKDLKPDLIFHYTIKPNIYGSIAAYLNKIPSLAITTGLGHLFDFKSKFIRSVTLLLYKIASSLSKEVWFLNDNDRDVFVYKNIVSANKVKILKGEGIDTSWFKPKKDKAPHRISFLFAGRLIWDKGVHEFVEAAKILKERCPELSFEMVGFIDQNNPNSVPYEKINEWQRGGFIKYHGETTDIRPYLEDASCLVFPSFYREGCSRIIMEAAAMETPVITTDHVGCKNLVDHNRSGFLVRTKDIEDLVNKIEAFISMSKEDRLVMGKLGRKKMIREFSEGKIIQEYLKTIDKYLGTKISLPQKLKLLIG